MFFRIALNNGLVTEFNFSKKKKTLTKVQYIQEITNKVVFRLADARNVTLRKHSINGAQVEVSYHPFTEENSESQISQVSH